MDQLRFLNPKTIEALNLEGELTTAEVLRDNLQEFTYSVRLRDKSTAATLTATLETLPELEELRLTFKKEPTRL